MTNRQILNKLYNLIEYIEKDTFRDENERIAVINGVEYRRSDFNNFKRVIEYCKDVYGSNIKASADYIENNKEYHRILANLQYYKHKKHKRESDFAAIERLNKRLEIVKEKRDIKKEKKKLREEEEYRRSVDESIIMREIEKEMEIKLK